MTKYGTGKWYIDGPMLLLGLVAVAIEKVTGWTIVEVDK